jgi:hypothetical protein
MLRASWALLTGVALLVSGTARAADNPLDGTWKLQLALQGDWVTIGLLKVETKDGKPSARVQAIAEEFKGASRVQNLTVAEGVLRFSLSAGGQTWVFEGKVPPAGSKLVLGALEVLGQLGPARLEATTLTSLDAFARTREILDNQPSDSQRFSATLVVLNQAAAKNLKPEEVRGYAEQALKAAEPYGARWQREQAVRMAEALANQAGLAPIAVDLARRAEQLLGKQPEPAAQARVLNVLAQALKNSDKAAEAKETLARLDALELKRYQEFTKQALPFQPETFTGRKVKSDRVVLVELFTGVQSVPSVPADLAFDALGQTYKPTEVVRLQYHFHSPRFDPLSNLPSEARRRYYSDVVEGAPSILFNGKLQAGGGGFIDDAQERYKRYRDGIELALEDAGKARLRATAVQKGDQVTITAEVSDLQEPGERTRLRLALVEPWVAYQGSNRLRYHHHVVRAMPGPGGADGVPLKEKTAKQTATVDLEEVRRSQDRYLDGQRFTEERPPVRLRRLLVVAFVQNDRTREVLQALQVEVRPEGSGAHD